MENPKHAGIVSSAGGPAPEAGKNRDDDDDDDYDDEDDANGNVMPPEAPSGREDEPAADTVFNAADDVVAGIAVAANAAFHVSHAARVSVAGAPPPAGADTPSFASLDPALVLDALDSIGLFGDGRLLALNSYENRVYQVGRDEGRPVVAKFYRPARWSDAQILEEHAFVAELVEREIPVVPATTLDGRTLHHFKGFRFSVFAMHGGRAPELGDPATLEWMGRFIGRIHAVGALSHYSQRPALDQVTFGSEPRGYLLDHGFIPAALRSAYESVVDEALAGIARCVERAGDVAAIRLHGDCHVGNVLWTDAGPHFVDFDDSRSGPAIQDLWMLLSGERADMVRQLSDLLAGYEDFCDFHPRQLYLIEALRTLRLIHYAAWLARRWDDPAFPLAFPWFGSERYWQDRILELREQVALMDEAPLWPA